MDTMGNFSLVFVGGVFLLLFAFTMQRTAHDARSRGKSPLLVCLLVLISFPLGLIIWLLFRPARVGTAGGPQPFPLDDRRLQ